MKMSIDELEGIAPKWDFTVAIGGIVYETVKPSDEDLVTLPKLVPDEAGLRAMASRYFVTQPPDDAWTLRRLSIFANGYLQYLFSFLKKTGEATDANFNEQFERQAIESFPRKPQQVK